MPLPEDTGPIALQRPGVRLYARPCLHAAPAVFGYHELRHALTIVGVACQYVAIAFFIVRAG